MCVKRKFRMKQTSKERVIVYIDGFNLYYGLKSKWKNRFLWLDLRLLSHNLLREHQSLEGVKYFTSRISQNNRDRGKWKRQNTFLEALNAMGGVKFYWGHYVRKRVSCPSCKSEWDDSEEKRTDVAIAVEMLVDAQQDRYDAAIVISGDSDLVPPVKKVIELYRKRIIIAFPPSRISGALSAMASGSFVIGRKKLGISMLPEKITKPDGYELSCPDRWKTKPEP